MSERFVVVTHGEGVGVLDRVNGNVAWWILPHESVVAPPRAKRAMESAWFWANRLNMDYAQTRGLSWTTREMYAKWMK